MTPLVTSLLQEVVLGQFLGIPKILRVQPDAVSSRAWILKGPAQRPVDLPISFDRMLRVVEAGARRNR